MKNKVLNRTLSFVLSATMAVSMGGFIPSAVYAGSSTEDAFTTFAWQDSTIPIQRNDTISFGNHGAAQANNAIQWNVENLSSSSSSSDGSSIGIFNIVEQGLYGSDAKGYSSSWKAGYTLSSAENNALESTTIAADQGENVPALSLQDGTTPLTLNDTGVAGEKVYLPSAYEIGEFKGNYPFGLVWTRNAVSTADQNAAVLSDYEGIFGPQLGAFADLKTSAKYNYRAAANLDLRNRDVALFKTMQGDETYKLTLEDTSIAQPKGASISISGNDAKVTLGESIPAGFKLGYMITSGAAYNEKASDGSYKAQSVIYGTAAFSDLQDKIVDITKSGDFTENDFLYIFYLKDNGTDETNYASQPLLLDWHVNPAKENFRFGTAEYDGGVHYLADDIYPAIVNGDTGKVTITKMVGADGTVYTRDGNNGPIHAGDYTVYGTAAAGNSLDPQGIQFNAITAETALGTFMITPRNLYSYKDNVNFMLPDVKQYSAATYTIPTLPLSGSAIVNGDKVNGVDVSVDLSATKEIKTLHDAQVTISKVNNPDYTVDPRIVTNTNDVNIIGAKVTAASIKTDPTTLNYAVGDNFDPRGLVLTLTYDDGTTSDIIYNNVSDEVKANFSFSPSTQLGGNDKNVNVYYTADSKLSAGSVPITVGRKIPSTDMQIAAKSLIVKVGQTIPLPNVNFTPSNTNDNRYISWSLNQDWTNPYAVLVDINGNVVENGDPSAYGIWGLSEEAGLIDLTAVMPSTGRTSTASVTVTNEKYSISWERLGGTDRYETAAIVAKKAFPNGAKTIVLVSGGSYPDALSASGFAGVQNIPIMITDTETLSGATADIIKAWGVTKVFIIGGPAAVSETVKTQLTSAANVPAAGIKRVAGEDRYQTAEAVYDEGLADNVWDGISVPVIVSGETPADALSISPWSYSFGMPILLAKNGALTARSMTIAKNMNMITRFAYICGGTAAVSQATENSLMSAGISVKRFAGLDRYDTSAMIAKYFAGDMTDPTGKTGDYNHTIFASGLDSHYPDPLVSSMLQAQYTKEDGKMATAPVLLVDGTSGAGFDLVRTAYTVASNDVNMLYVIGGTAAVPETTANAIMSSWDNITRLPDNS